jgi:ABC-2 type transport system permease protein
MFKLVKYELRSTFLTIIGICITVIIASLLLMTKKASWDVAVTALSVCLTIGAIIVIFISSLKIMSKYLHEDSGYLLFTLPQSGVSIIISRLITALIQISIVAFVALSMCYLTVTDKLVFSFFKDVKVSVILYSIISYIWAIIFSLTFIYFCMVIGKVALKGKKLGKIGSFIIFILLSLAISWLSFKIVTLFPQTLNLGDFSTTTNYKTSNSSFSISGASLNIAKTIFDIITFALFFITTSYLIDKKLDLS